MGPMALTQHVQFGKTEFVALGERRQLETVPVMKQLGSEPECIAFFGYPDRSLNQLWNSDWR